MFFAKIFQKPEFLSQENFTNATFGIFINDWHYIPFYTRCYFFIFQFPHVFRKFSAVHILFVAYIRKASTIPKYFMPGFLGDDTTALYTMFAVKHLLSSRHSAPFLTLHPHLLEVSWIILPLWEAMTEPIFLQQL